MAKDTISILDGSTFLVSDLRGDIEASPDQAHGFFFRDTRSIGDGFHEDVTVINHGGEPLAFELRLDAGADFADLFEVKDALQKKGENSARVEGDTLVLAYRRGDFVRETRIRASSEADVDERGLTFHLRIDAHSEWSTCIFVQPVTTEAKAIKYRHDDEEAKPNIGMSLAEFLANAPRLETDWDPLEHVYERSLIDLAALRFETTLFPGQPMPAAGLPWFMTVFGRDSLLTSFQALPFVPDLAETTLRVLAKYQATEVDDFRDAEPGKILHEIRFGELTHFDERPHSPYYGTADATPLFLVLLDEVERWTGNAELVRELEPNARAALEWINRWGDRDGDGYVEYERRNKETGLENQCWKDSWDSIRFADGSIAKGPIATCEIQGYVYDAKIRTARLARDLWDDEALADRLERDAEELKRRFNDDFWLEERGFYALALDGEKRPVDSLTSNAGHLLWSGIVPDGRAQRVAEQLVGEQLFSGWGVRTMADGEGGYNPIRYHNGTVWPHDNSLIAHGLARYGFRDEAARVALATLEAATFFRYRLPEVFAGYRRGRTSFPVEYPTASSPQAWATGTPLLLLRVLLGLEPDGDELRSDPHLPDTIERIELVGIPGRWGRADVASVEEVSNVA
jgi:glycogen debranching enzyme